jgi:signal transduction histidine kinase
MIAPPLALDTAVAVAVAWAGVGWRLRAVRAAGLARACHELRGPLTAARLGLQLGLRTGGLTREQLRAIDLALDRAGLAVDDLHSARRPTPSRPVDIAALVRDSAAAMRPLAAAHDAHLSVNVPGEPVLVRGERLRLAQLVGNLLANAIEHGGGEVELALTVRGDTVRVAVHDGGSGLTASPARLARHARRVDPARGHGWSISAPIARRHGGRLTVVTSSGAAPGACVVLELRRHDPDAFITHRCVMHLCIMNGMRASIVEAWRRRVPRIRSASVPSRSTRRSPIARARSPN